VNIDYPLWMEIDSQSLHNNFTRILQHLSIPNASRIIGVVKADAYGHGIESVLLLQKWGMNRFGVATVQEGEALRQLGIKGTIYLLGGFINQEIPGIFKNHLTPALSSREEWDQLKSAVQLNQQELEFHLKIDSGMYRMGFLPEELDESFIEQMSHHPYLRLKGVMTHFASSENDPTYTHRQFEIFQNFLQKKFLSEQVSIQNLEKHCCNSAGFLFFPHYHLDMVRVGIALFGVSPIQDPSPVRSLGLSPVMRIKSRVKLLKHLPSGCCIGYGGTCITERPTRLAVIPIGYAQGLLRRLSNRMEVLIKGQRAKCLGVISMDQMMVDVTSIPDVKRGDLVTILGSDGPDEIRAEEMAAWAETIPHEILCSFIRIKNRIVV
jgi:alanine racemase